jgi:5-formyltetrahydrofolate cyclo-ligase
MSEKQVLRRALLAARAALDPARRAAADAALVAAARLLIRGAARVAAYVPLPGEPGGPALPDALAAELPRHGLLLPSLQPDLDLDWVAYDGTLEPGTARRRLREPSGPRLGVDAIATAEIVLVPAVAVDMSGARLGRGGGSYDRSLARARPSSPIIALVYRDEIVPVIPVEDHDCRVTAALTPDGMTAFGS